MLLDRLVPPGSRRCSDGTPTTADADDLATDPTPAAPDAGDLRLVWLLGRRRRDRRMARGGQAAGPLSLHPVRGGGRVTARCASCGIARPLAELLAVTSVANPARGYFVCRPSLPGYAFCFRNKVGSAAVESIAFADREAAVFGPTAETNARRGWGGGSTRDPLDRPRPVVHTQPRNPGSASQPVFSPGEPS